jgi:type IV pilus assembly protein PilB
LNRLADMGIERYLIASSLACITAQRLVRTNCPNCSTAAEATAEETQLLYSKGMIAEEDLPRLRLMKGQGCGSCGHTGYQGRMAIHEVLVIDQEIRSFMSSAEQLAGMEQSLHGKGYRTMLDDGLFKVLEGKTSVQEVLRAAFSE